MTATHQSNSRKILPIGIQDFRTIRKENHYYVDKTQLIHQLVSQGRHYFLSRPRRFGKSLLLDTMRELFECNEELFRGLDIHDKWDWSEKHTVVHLSFGGNYSEPAQIEEDILEQLEGIEFAAGLKPPQGVRSGPVRLRNLLRRLHQTTGQPVAVLVDEYDKPILDVLNNESLATQNRDYLSGFYGIIKDSARHVRFVFVTGVSMFTKVNLFSGLNNLKNISMVPQFATICGYTEGDLDLVFAPELSGLDQKEIRRWYNGYNWLGEERVYNPYDVLLLFRTREFKSHWMQTGNPMFLYRLMAENRIPAMNVESGGIDEIRLTKFDIGNIELRPLMFQSGYLTIAEKKRVGAHTVYTLEYPNLEVRKEFSSGFLAYMGRDAVEARTDSHALLEHLASNDFSGYAERLRAMYAAIPHEWYRKSEIERYEGYYLSVLFVHFNAMGVDVQPEESSNRGQADLVLRHSGQVFVIEGKVVEDESEGHVEDVLVKAIEQIRGRGYVDKYRGRGTAVHLIAKVFGKESRNLAGLKVEAA